jgi:hypothetical protein
VVAPLDSSGNLTVTVVQDFAPVRLANCGVALPDVLVASRFAAVRFTADFTRSPARGLPL